MQNRYPPGFIAESHAKMDPQDAQEAAYQHEREQMRLMEKVKAHDAISEDMEKMKGGDIQLLPPPPPSRCAQMDFMRTFQTTTK